MPSSIDWNGRLGGGLSHPTVRQDEPKAASEAGAGLHVDGDTRRLQDRRAFPAALPLPEAAPRLPGASPAASPGVAAARLSDPYQHRAVGQGMYDVTVTPGTPNHTFLSDNEVPMTSMVLNSETVKGDGLSTRFIAQAALKANPDIQFIVPTRQLFDGASDPRFVAEQQRIADRLGVPPRNVLPARTDMAAWPQDEFIAGMIGGKPRPLEALGFGLRAWISAWQSVTTSSLPLTFAFSDSRLTSSRAS